jgi:hypothetical protein
LCFFPCNLFASAEIVPFISYVAGKSAENMSIIGSDFYIPVIKYKNTNPELKKDEFKFGWRICSSVTDNSKNGTVRYNSINFITSSEFVINKNFSFNIKGLSGIGIIQP